ncbi:TlpA family protein disulfide reductase [Xanthovirga aplysinae]|uniref:TlpA family protein disulfide reductase n=1 Tax=Xanthovirga aplysinae TaxID=2529853 RepID=UPI0012BD3BB8|nr:TlpA disulfide reductase family protein [Xanthovirga aplysinae]MTI29655.1 TlpA family protein disulfide reductase [Xanthovirga aplysinae]
MSKILTIIAGLIIIMSSCQKNQTGKETLEANSQEFKEVKIEGVVTNPKGDEVTVSLTRLHYTMPKQIVSSKIDENGHFSLIIPLEQATEALLMEGKERTTLFLSPGDELKVTLDANQFDESLKYEGKGAEVNNYLAKKALKGEELGKNVTGNIYELEPLNFQNTLNERYLQLKELYKSYFQGKTAPTEFATYEMAQLKSTKAVQFGNYADYHKYYTKKESVELPEGFDDFKKDINYNDDKALISPAYRNLVNSYSLQLYSEETKEKPKTEQEYTDRRLKLNAHIKEKFTGSVQEYLLATNILSQISYTEAAILGDQINEFKNAFSKSLFLATINEKFDKWRKLAPGMKAPDFKYDTPEGKEVALSELKGKVVYIDVWASWCGPCKREMPFSKEISDKFIDQKDVVFMYVSVDDEEEDWRKYMEKNKEPHGLNLWAKGWSEIADEYLISSIPRYILVGKDGKIISSRAPRPSSGEVEELIKSHLNENS